MGVRFHWPVFGGEAFLRTDYAWTDKYFFDNENTATLRNGSENNLNVTAGFTTGDGHWNVSLWSKNLTDERNNSSLFALFGTVYANYQAPRTYGLSVAWKN